MMRLPDRHESSGREFLICVRARDDGKSFNDDQFEKSNAQQRTKPRRSEWDMMRETEGNKTKTIKNIQKQANTVALSRSK